MPWSPPYSPPFQELIEFLTFFGSKIVFINQATAAATTTTSAPAKWPELSRSLGQLVRWDTKKWLHTWKHWTDLISHAKSYCSLNHQSLLLHNAQIHHEYHYQTVVLSWKLRRMHKLQKFFYFQQSMSQKNSNIIRTFVQRGPLRKSQRHVLDDGWFFVASKVFLNTFLWVSVLLFTWIDAVASEINVPNLLKRLRQA